MKVRGCSCPGSPHLPHAPSEGPYPEIEASVTIKGAKHDQGKARYSLLPRECLAGVITVLEFGAKKYAAWSWPTVPEGLTRYRDALDRHWDSATGTGLASEIEECDHESGLKHAWHFLCCAVFLAWFLVHKPEQVVSYRARQRGESQ
jgi:dATP/dGTP diphosphohydrolase